MVEELVRLRQLLPDLGEERCPALAGAQQQAVPLWPQVGEKLRTTGHVKRFQRREYRYLDSDPGQLTRLDALGERLSALAGIKDIRFTEAPGLGGAAPTLLPPQNLSLAEFSEKLSALSRQVETRNDMLGVLEAQLFEQAVKKKFNPNMRPVTAPYNASGFGRSWPNIVMSSMLRIASKWRARSSPSSTRQA